MHSRRPPWSRRASFRGRGPARGFTLAELLIALAIAGVVLTYAVHAGSAWLLRYQQRVAAEGLAQALQRARSEAINRGHRVVLCPSSGGLACDGGKQWEAGYVIFADPDDDASVDAGEQVVRVAAPAGRGISVRGNKPVADYVSYTPLGTARLKSGALQMGTFTVCRPGATAIEVVLANGGRPRLQEAATPCP
jgi:type IV fimbrial biogenesis protein FimT